MGNAAKPGETREVVLSLHSVHNVDHAPNESYYGMATNHVLEAELPVTSERPARLSAGIDSVLSVRIFLHRRGSNRVDDRPVGQVSIPVREMLETCGPGAYQTWFLLDEATPYDVANRPRLTERFRHAMHAASQDLFGSRICMSLLEASAQPGDWGKLESEREHVTYYTPLFVSHMQSMQITDAYFDHLERSAPSGVADAAEPRRQPGAVGSGAPKGAIEAGELRPKLERLQRQRLDEEMVVQLQQELDDVTEEANRRIEAGNEAIIRLKTELKQLRDAEAPEVQAERASAEARLEAARRRRAELQAQAQASMSPPDQDKSSGPDKAELDKLRQDLLVLTNQKAALMKMVQDVYGSSKGGAAKSDAPGAGERKLLPDPAELLGSAGALKPL